MSRKIDTLFSELNKFAKQRAHSRAFSNNFPRKTFARRLLSARQRFEFSVLNYKKPRVLIVEDDAVLRRGLARIFPSEEFEVIQAADGEDAVETISNGPPDLIICDFRIPGIDGIGVLNHLKQVNRATGFILVTAHYTEELMKEAYARGAAAVLEKPFELPLLKQKCEELLNRLSVSSRA